MIVGSLLLILVAVGLLVGGVLGGSNALIICCIIVVVLAAIVLVLGVKQSAASGAAFGIDIDGEADETSEYPAVPGRGFRVRQSDRRVSAETPAIASGSRRGARAAAAGSDVTADHGRMIVEEQVGRGIPSQGVPDRGTTPSRRSHAAPDDDDDPYEPPIQSFAGPVYEVSRDDIVDSMTATDVIDAREVAALDTDAGLVESREIFDSPDAYGSREIFSDQLRRENDPLGNGDGGERFDEGFDEDPPDEPSAQMVSPANAARVAMLSADVLVVDGRPRYHVAGCVHLHGRETEPLPVGEAVELGFTPCALCEPDSALLADARRV